MSHPDSLPSLVFADGMGNISDFSDLSMCGISGRQHRRPQLTEIIELPEGSELFCLPDRLPVGWQRESNEPVLLGQNPFNRHRGLQAVAAFIAPAHTSILTASFQEEKKARRLPLFAYTAVGWLDGRFWVTAFRSDPDIRQDSSQYQQETVARTTRQIIRQHPENRLIAHLGNCCLQYGCPAARNFFLKRWEAPLPTSPLCNARCLGCISLQESGCCKATQERIDFVPTAAEIAGVAVPHLEDADNPIVSYGQGCEGEPLLQGPTLAAGIKEIRNATSRGTINLNSNASLPAEVARLADTGLDSMRVSLNSAREDFYNLYYRPKGYSFQDITDSIDAMKARGKFVSLNYFILPGFTDSPAEFAALSALIDRHQVDFLQLRNLNIDPYWYSKQLGSDKDAFADQPMGILQWQKALKKTFPRLGFGYFNPQVGRG